jgi:hypothetical protein
MVGKQQFLAASKRGMLVALATVMVFAGGSAGMAERADAACAEWEKPSYFWRFRQSNGWRGLFELTNRRAVAFTGRARTEGRVTLDSFTATVVKFLITWTNGSAGIYTGSIDDNGFVSGTTVDRWNRGSRTSWHLENILHCNRRT